MTPDEPTEAERDARGETDEPEDLRDSHGDDAMRALLKRSLTRGDGGGGESGESGESGQHGPMPSRAFLHGVQKRIRTRSRGRFFADGWSTSEPRVSYALVAIVMLLVMGVAYMVLGPAGIAK